METKKIYLNDGRQAEERSYVNGDGDVVVEIWAEDAKVAAPLRLAERITEKKAEVIVERIIDKIDVATGEIIERKIEAIEPNVELKLREHIGIAEKPVASLSKQDIQTMVAQAVEAKSLKNDVKVSMQKFVGERVKAQKASSNMVDFILLGIIVIGAVVAIYKLF